MLVDDGCVVCDVCVLCDVCVVLDDVPCVVSVDGVCVVSVDGVCVVSVYGVCVELPDDVCVDVLILPKFNIGHRLRGVVAEPDCRRARNVGTCTGCLPEGTIPESLRGR